MRVGIADHLGWAVAVAASPDHRVVERRRIELVEPGVPVMPIHHPPGDVDDRELAEIVATVRASAARATSAALDELATALPSPVSSISLRTLPTGIPDDIARLRRPPWDARADAVMYREVLAADAAARGWEVYFYDSRHVEDEAVGRLGDRAEDVLRGPRTRLGPPWAKDHRVALAATVVAETRPS